jgi:hypothetical protein
MQEAVRIIKSAPTASGFEAYDEASKATWWYVNLKLPSGAVMLVRCRINEQNKAECSGGVHTTPDGVSIVSRN